MNHISSLRDRLISRHGGGGYEEVAEPSSALNETALNEGSHEAWNDHNDGHYGHDEPASTRYSSDYVDDDEVFEDAHNDRLQEQEPYQDEDTATYDDTDPYYGGETNRSAVPASMINSSSAYDSRYDYEDPSVSRESRYDYGDPSNAYESEGHSDPDDVSIGAGRYVSPSRQRLQPLKSRAASHRATKRGVNRDKVYVEKPHTAFEDVGQNEKPDEYGLPFHPDEPEVGSTHPEEFPVIFHHPVGEYGEFSVFARLYLEIRQLFMFFLTLQGLMCIAILAFARYFNPFRKTYPKARVDFEFERRITGERYSERVQYYTDFWGYQCEEYDIVTRGGWILKAHRVSDPRRPGGRGYPVVVQHGILCTSLFYFTNEERSLGFWLVDQGFDVWSTNIRSNMGAGHTKYKRWDPRFWAWGLGELGDDLFDVVNFVLRETGYRQLAYIGHSQGTGSMFLALTKYKELGKKLSSFTALGPAVYPGKSLNRLPFRVMSKLPSRWAWSLVFGVRDFMPPLNLVRLILPKFLYAHLAYIIFGYLFDFHDHNWLDRQKPKIFCSTGVTTSSELLYYWIHCFVARGCVFDPRIRTPWFPETFPPLMVAYGSMDHLVVGKPLIDRLLAYESNVQIVHILELQGYEHMDMVLGVDAYKVVFPKIKDTIVRTIDPEDVPFLGY